MTCACGCGLPLKSARRKYRHGQWAKTDAGRLRMSAVHFADARTDHGDGYISVRKAFGEPHQLEHIAIAEKAYGGPLPHGVQVHHVDEDRSNNAPSNLVICSATFHRLLHIRTDAYKSCGCADWRKCSFCGRYDDPANLYIPASRGTIEHRTCGNEYRKKWKESKNAHA